MDAVSLQTRIGSIAGYCDPAFRALVDAFAENFERRGELGASLALTVDGRSVVDLWGGLKTEGGEAWQRDSVTIVFSATKGATALCTHMAADRHQIDLDAPVTRYWPEFGQAGKDGALVSMMLDHSVGVPAIRERLKTNGAYDYAYMCDVVAAEAPFWKPGTRNGYHGLTFAWTVGELVRRATGKRVGAFLRDEIAGPLGIDFWIGLPEEQEARVVEMIPYTRRNPHIVRAVEADPSGITALFYGNAGGYKPNTREGRAAEIGSGNGVSNARGLAGLYAPLANGGAYNGVRLLGAEAVTRMGKVAVASHEDATVVIPTRFSLGYMKSMDNRALENPEACSAILSETAFGHVGGGGSIGFADPECRMSFGYTMNRMGLGFLLNERGQSLVDAAYRAVGYRTNAGGAWTR